MRLAEKALPSNAISLLPARMRAIQNQVGHDSEVVGGESIIGFYIEDLVSLDDPVRVSQNIIEASHPDSVELVSRARRDIRQVCRRFQPGQGKQPAARGNSP